MENRVDEVHLLDRLRQGDEKAFDQIFETYYGYLFKIAFSILPEQDAAKDCVQEVFVRIWQKSATLEVRTTLKGYLQQSIVHECLAYLRKKKNAGLPEPAATLPDRSHSVIEHLEMESLSTLVNAAIEKLPEQCRLIFRMSRMDEMSYREIAELLDLSPKTVENQIGRALKQLRTDLAPWLAVLLPLLGACFVLF